MFGQFTGEEKLDGGLDFSGGECVFLVVSDQLGGFKGDLLEDIADEGVHDGHGFLGNSSVAVNLFQNFVDVDSEGFVSSSSSLASAFSVGSASSVLGGSGLGSGTGVTLSVFSSSFLRCHLVCYYFLFGWLIYERISRVVEI